MGTDKAFDLSQSPGHLLHRAQQFAAERFSRNLSAGDKLTQRQFAVLAATAANEGLTQTDLVRETGIDRSTLAELVARMAIKGLVRRESVAADARANAIFLTDDGQAIYDRAIIGARLADEAILSSLPKNKRASFLVTLRRIAMTIEEDEARAKAELKKLKDADKKAKKKAKKKARKKKAKLKKKTKED
jgi:MarR family transcriptional regulator, temperature-dependent positive regulator of motility